MHRIIALHRKLLITLLTLIISSWTTLLAATVTYADASTCTPPMNNDAGNGVRWPVGADAATFVYQCTGTYAGMWTNSYYVYDPSTNTRSPLYNPDYTYDCASDIWSRIDWEYSPSAAAYQESRINTSDPGLPTGCPTPASAQASSIASDTNITNSQPSASTAGAALSNNNNTHDATSAATGNTLSSYADTGNASVIGNTTGGGATTGNATNIANIANLLQSTSNVFGPNTAVFTADINGNVNGSILLDPSTMLNTGTNSNNTVAGDVQLNTNNTSSTDVAMNNNINVAAQSGAATVANNTTGGNATSGNAEAIANLMNVINSTVEAGRSFVGTVNINGDLNGDILLPQGLVNQLLASTGYGSNNVTSTSTTDSSTGTNAVTETVNNSLTSNAHSGNASVANNTTGGNATSGNASTNITLLNLTGSNLVAANDLLVFVNVLGKWYGMIMNAPTGTSAAEFGGAVTSSGNNSANTINSNTASKALASSKTNLVINNNVNVSAHSGNASVANNTTGGNATSGNASTAINLLNIEGSNLSLTNWFGILFINVFGTWNGSFGIAPLSNITPNDTTGTNTTENVIQENTQQALHAGLNRFATFIASASPSTAASNFSTPTSQSAVLADYTVSPTTIRGLTKEAALPATNSTHTTYLPILGIVIAAFFLAISEYDHLSHLAKKALKPKKRR